MITDFFENVLNILVPIKKESQRKGQTKKYISKQILKIIYKKHPLFNIGKEKADLSAYNTNKLIRNATNQIIRKTSTKRTKKIVEGLPDYKQQCKIINSKR